MTFFYCFQLSKRTNKQVDKCKFSKGNLCNLYGHMSSFSKAFLTNYFFTLSYTSTGTLQTTGDEIDLDEIKEALAETLGNFHF